MHATATARQSPSPSEWFASWFDSTHYHRLYAHRDECEATALIDRLIEQLQPRHGAAVLDLGCGTGRHARHMAARGCDVTGIDLSTESLALARRRLGANVRWMRQDMRQPFGTEAFEYVFSLFTSFGYFEDRADHFAVVRNIARSLTADGCLVLDYLNVDRAESHLVREEVTERDGIVYRVSRWSEELWGRGDLAVADEIISSGWRCVSVLKR